MDSSHVKRCVFPPSLLFSKTRACVRCQAMLYVLFLLVQIYCNWRWPTPIVLQQIDHQNPMGMKQWDPRLDYRDQSHLMPIITPAYPCMNSSYNVSDSTLKIMMVRFMPWCTAWHMCTLCVKPGLSIFGVAGSEQPSPCLAYKEKYVHVLLSTFQGAHLGSFSAGSCSIGT